MSLPTTTFSSQTDILKFNRGEITPTFTAPASCLQTPTSGSLDSSFYVGHFRSSFYNSACYPSSTAVSLWDLYYYSPAPACPESYTTASTFLNTYAGFQSTIVLELSSDTSAYLCCPTGYDPQADDHACISSFVGTTTITYFGPTEDALGNFSPTTPLTAVMTFPSATPLVITGDGIPIWYQSSDKALLTQKTTSTKSSATGSSTSSTVALSTSATITDPASSATNGLTTSISSSKSNSGLSSGAKGGIGAGIALLLVAIVFALFFFFRRRNRSVYQYRVPDPGTPEVQGTLIKELPNTEVRTTPELQGNSVMELQDTGRYPLAELDGSYSHFSRRSRGQPPL